MRDARTEEVERNRKHLPQKLRVLKEYNGSAYAFKAQCATSELRSNTAQKLQAQPPLTLTATATPYPLLCGVCTTLCSRRQVATSVPWKVSHINDNDFVLLLLFLFLQDRMCASFFFIAAAILRRAYPAGAQSSQYMYYLCKIYLNTSEVIRE